MSDPKRDPHDPAATVHRPVLVREVLTHLDLRPGLVVIDGTVGAAGHSQKILELIGPTGTLVGLDRDPMMLRLAAQRVSGPNCHLIHSSYAQSPDVLRGLGLTTADRVLLDLGLSSDQLADRSRGFSFDADGPLDLRFDATQGTPASQLVAELEQQELEGVLRNYGEERFAAEIAAELVRRRAQRPVGTARELTEAVVAAVPAKFRQDARKHPATRVFQALRIAANEELKQLEQALGHALVESLAPGGRAVIVTFHSLEDRLVKDAFRDQMRWENLTPKPVTATPLEQKVNPRSRTAKLRAAIRK